jgi:hypothetical protein
MLLETKMPPARLGFSRQPRPAVYSRIGASPLCGVGGSSPRWHCRSFGRHYRTCCQVNAAGPATTSDNVAPAVKLKGEQGSGLCSWQCAMIRSQRPRRRWPPRSLPSHRGSLRSREQVFFLPPPTIATSPRRMSEKKTVTPNHLTPFAVSWSVPWQRGARSASPRWPNVVTRSDADPVVGGSWRQSVDQQSHHAGRSCYRHSVPQRGSPPR